jgi:geranylgeranyl pyrophosphate synthase
LYAASQYWTLCCGTALQVAILAGDFLLARASVSLAALRNSDVIQLLSQVIEDLVSGEIMQVTWGAC